VPERRGYGQSEGATLTEEIGRDDRGTKFVERMRAEADDVNAAIDYAQAHLAIDPRRIVMMGYSNGGIATTLAAANRPSLVAVINQASGAVSWDKGAELREALIAAAKKIRAPMWCAAAENDATTDNVRAICDASHAAGGAATLTIYPPFVNPANPNARNAGHGIFGPAGVDIWKQDLLDFLAKHRSRTGDPVRKPL
jgi:dienelactone hydrolase